MTIISMTTHVGRFLDLYLMLLDIVALGILGNYLYGRLALAQGSRSRQRLILGMPTPTVLAIGLMLYIFGHTTWRFLTLFNERAYTGWPYLVSTVILTIGLTLTVRTLSSVMTTQMLVIVVLAALIASGVILWATINYTSLFLAHVS